MGKTLGLQIGLFKQFSALPDASVELRVQPCHVVCVPQSRCHVPIVLGLLFFLSPFFSTLSRQQ